MRAAQQRQRPTRAAQRRARREEGGAWQQWLHYTAAFARRYLMLRRALPLVLATLVIVPALAQDRIVSSTFRSAGATAQAPGQRAAASQAPYFPERFDWQHKKPDEVGMNPALVNEAVQ